VDREAHRVQEVVGDGWGVGVLLSFLVVELVL